MTDLIRISRDFTWEEMTRSETAKKHGIVNEPGIEEKRAIEELVKCTLQPLRTAYGRPIRISSGYRCKALNKLVGGSPTSQHMKGRAADCVAGDASRLLGILLAYNLPFDQAILYRKRNFLHVSLRSSQNRRKVVIQDN
ncbi:MAG: peptidase M15 [Tannerellaceae bacterium]|nr:peptidase M15 [Tannerellaceae bacterium]